METAVADSSGGRPLAVAGFAIYVARFPSPAPKSSASRRTKVFLRLIQPPLPLFNSCIVTAYDRQKGGCKKRSNPDKMLRARAR